MDDDQVREVDVALQRDSAAPALEDASNIIAAKHSYRCYFTGIDDRIQTYEQMECEDDAGAALKAEGLLSGSKFTSAEVWQGKRFVGKWSNPVPQAQSGRAGVADLD